MKATWAMDLSEKNYITILNNIKCHILMTPDCYGVLAFHANLLRSKLCPRYSQVLEQPQGWWTYVETFRLK